MISKEELTRIAAKKGFPLAVIEKDYALTWSLKAVYANPKLSKYLVFKGGTCLSKVYAGMYRLSEDLDFSAYKDGWMDNATLLAEVRAACADANSTGAPNLAIIEDTVHENPGMLSFRLRYSGILNQAGKLKMEITLHEWVQFESKHEITKELSYPDIESFTVHCYDLIEILSEKLRAIIQRGKSRDYYDTWQIVTRKGLMSDAKADLSNIHNRLKEKCDRNKLAYEPEKMFEDKRVETVKDHWEHGLAHLVKPLPEFDEVIASLSEVFWAEKELAHFTAKPDFENIRNLWRDPANTLLVFRAIDITIDKLDSKRAAEVVDALDFLITLCIEIPELKKRVEQRSKGYLVILEHDSDRNIKDAVERLKNVLA
ncbi:MAG: nucleotidyl transferase AbiEii/AbiGii toxin family protein [Candidatus Micrarchaeia archaeon]|jgi:predicted nucleotidyltransferase component of viral defense system